MASPPGLDGTRWHRWPQMAPLVSLNDVALMITGKSAKTVARDLGALKDLECARACLRQGLGRDALADCSALEEKERTNLLTDVYQLWAEEYKAVMLDGACHKCDDILFLTVGDLLPRSCPGGRGELWDAFLEFGGLIMTGERMAQDPDRRGGMPVRFGGISN